MSAVAVLLAIGASFTTHASEKKVLGPVNGYISPIGWPCGITVGCSNTGFQACTAWYNGNLYQAFEKASYWDTVCIRVTYKL